MPTIALTGTGVLGLGALAAIAVGLVVLFWNKKAIVAAINPLDEKNVANQTTNATVTALTGREETLGGWLADMFNPSAKAVTEMLNPSALKPTTTSGFMAGELQSSLANFKTQ